MSEQKKLVVDLKLQIPQSGIPKPLMDFLKRTGPKAKNQDQEGIINLIYLCNDLGLTVTLVITQPGDNA